MSAFHVGGHNFQIASIHLSSQKVEILEYLRIESQKTTLAVPIQVLISANSAVTTVTVAACAGLVNANWS